MSTSGDVRSVNEIWLTAETAAISDRIEFGVPAIDSAFGGGIYCGKLTEIHGAAGSGKTQLALTLVAQELITSHVEGTNGVLIYFHTGGTFPIARLCEMIEGKMQYVDPSVPADPTVVKGILKNLCIDKVTEPGELVMKLVNMYGVKDDSKNIRLVVIDSIAPLFRSTFHSKGGGKNPRSNLLQVSSFLKRLASEMDLAILVLNEVTGGGDSALKPGGGSTTNVKPVLGDTWTQCLNCRASLQIQKSMMVTRRFLQVLFNVHGPPSGPIAIQITRCGVEAQE